MTSLRILRAAAILSMMIATPVFAQAAIQEPGAFAFYHPNADVLHSGPSPMGEAVGAMAAVPYGNSDAYAPTDSNMDASSCARRYHSYDPESGTFLGYDGRRRQCL